MIWVNVAGLRGDVSLLFGRRKVRQSKGRASRKCLVRWASGEGPLKLPFVVSQGNFSLTPQRFIMTGR